MDRKKCPYCGEEIAATAKKCRFCGEWLDESAKPQSAPQQSQPTSQPHPADQQADPQQPVYQQPEPQEPVYQQPEPQEPVYQQTEPAYQQPGHTVDYGFDSDDKGFFQTYFVDSFLKPYANFSGYTSRKEFWLTYVALMLVNLGVCGLGFLLMGLAGGAGMIIFAILTGLFSLGILVPSLALCCRRLRDGGFSPWLILLQLIPGIGAIILLVMFCLPSKYEHEPARTRFNATDYIITGVCIVLMIVGSILGVKGLFGGFRSGQDYDYDQEWPIEVESVEETVIEESAIDVIDYEEVVDPEIEAQIDAYAEFVDDLSPENIEASGGGSWMAHEAQAALEVQEWLDAHESQMTSEQRSRYRELRSQMN